MGLWQRSALPNALTVLRVLIAPAIFFLIFWPGFGARALAFVLFLIAALSDVWDGYLARKHGWITDFGKLVDPLADKLLLAATFVPFYILSRRPDPGPLPLLGSLPLWILLVIFGREVLVTVLRMVAARRGVVLAAGRAGKQKALLQNIFIGSTLAWYAIRTAAVDAQWSGPLWGAWQTFHGVVVATTLVLAVSLTLYSLAVYLWRWRLLIREAI